MDTRILRIPWTHSNRGARSKTFDARGSLCTLLDLRTGYDSGWLQPVDRIVGCVSGSIFISRENARHEVMRGSSWISLGDPRAMRIQVTGRRALVWLCEGDELIDAIAIEMGGTHENGVVRMTIDVPKTH